MQMEKQFQQAAEQMSIVISSGGSLQAAIERASLEAKEPLKRELELMVAQTKLNMPTAEVFKWQWIEFQFYGYRLYEAKRKKWIRKTIL